ncbi:Y-family DNA polymerase [Parapedomonas caeni]
MKADVSSWLALWLPRLAIDRWRRLARQCQPPRPEPPEFALVDSGPHGQLVSAVNAGARRAGVQPGQPLARARALCPTLATQSRDSEADQAALVALARWCDRYTPLVALDGADGLLLDLTGCLGLWPGPDALLDDIEVRLRAMGWRPRLGLAATVGGAWALARFAPPDQRRVTSAGLAGFAALPVAALRLSADSIGVLERFGLRTIGALAGLPRSTLARRFPARTAADAVLLRLDQLLGVRAEPAAPYRSPPRHAVRQAFAEPLLNRAQVAAWLPRLVEALVQEMAAAGVGARRLALQAMQVDGQVSALRIGLAQPSREVPHILRLFAPRLERLTTAFGIDALVLAAIEVAPLAARQVGLTGPDGSTELARLQDCLANRLGAQAVYRLAGVASHVPERAERRARTAGPPTHVDAPRPILLLPRPEPVEVLAEVPDGPPARIVWRRGTHRIVRSTGPERIAPEWWRDAAATARSRDYYSAEDSEGRRLWLFREGLYEGAAGEPDGAPRWYLHGLMA